MSVSDTSPLVDWAQLLPLRELQPPGMPDVVDDLIDAFVTDSTARMEHLRHAASTGDMAVVRLEAHTLKGSSGPLGATQLPKIAAAVEQAAGAGGGPELAPLIDRLAVVLAGTQAELRRGQLVP